MSLLEVKNLHTFFKTKKGIVKAVNDVTYSLEAGKTLGIVGESGSGKSVSAMSIIRLLDGNGYIESGSITFDGQDILAASDKDLHHIRGNEISVIFQEPMTALNPVLRIRSQMYEAFEGEKLSKEEMRVLRKDLQLIFQDPYSSLNPRMTVGQIIGEGLVSHGVFKRGDPAMRDYIFKVMEDCGLATYMFGSYPHQFSGGQRQRIGIARSLALNPAFVVCDEAVSALDVSIQSQILNLLSDLKEKQNLTYLFITHDLSVVKYISDRIGVMYLGNMVELAPTEELFANTLHPYTEALLSAIPVVDEEDKRERILLEGDIPSPVNPPSGCKFHTRCRYCQQKCKEEVPEWTDVGNNHYVACHFPLHKKEG